LQLSSIISVPQFLFEAIQGSRHLKDQLHRAASSVALNLAEGTGRSSAREQKRFFDIAMGSLRECQAALDLCPETGSEAQIVGDRLGAHLYRLIQAVSRRVGG